jgi:D-alanyl-D-alanine carboxypeptidase (penicillin-binding protein 5/6)
VARANEAQKLLNWGYTAYEGLRLFDGQPAGAGAAGLEGRRKDRQARPDPADRAGGAGRHASRIKTQVVRPDPLVAPFTKGQQVGTLKITAGDQLLREVPLVALQPVEQAGIFGRAWDAIRLWIK